MEAEAWQTVWLNEEMSEARRKQRIQRLRLLPSSENEGLSFGFLPSFLNPVIHKTCVRTTIVILLRNTFLQLNPGGRTSATLGAFWAEASLPARCVSPLLEPLLRLLVDRFERAEAKVDSPSCFLECRQQSQKAH